MFKAKVSSSNGNFLIERKVSQYVPSLPSWEYSSRTNDIGGYVCQFIKITTPILKPECLHNGKLLLFYKYLEDYANFTEDSYLHVYKTNISRFEDIFDVSFYNEPLLSTFKVSKPQTGDYNILEIDLGDITWIDNSFIIMLKHNAGNGKYIQLVDGDSYENYNNTIIFDADYVELSGLESHTQYDKYSVTTAGTSLVSLFDGNVFHQIDLISTQGKLNPINLTYFIKSGDSDLIKKHNYEFDLDTSDDNQIIFTDYIGVKSYYTKTRKNELFNLLKINKETVKNLPDDIYYCYNNQSFIYYKSNLIHIRDNKENGLTFNMTGKLINIVRKGKNVITVNWSNDKISKIINIEGEELHFSYDNDDFTVEYKINKNNQLVTPLTTKVSVSENYILIYKNVLNDYYFGGIEILLSNNRVTSICNERTYDKITFEYDANGCISKVNE